MLWPTDYPSEEFLGFIDVLGVSLKLESFFFDYLTRAFWKEEDASWRVLHPGSNTGIDDARLRSTALLKVDSLHSAVAIDKQPLDQAGATPVLLVAGSFELALRGLHRSFDRRSALYDMIRDSRSTEHSSAPGIPRASCRLPDFAKLCVRLFSKFLRTHQKFVNGADDLLLGCLLSLLETDIIQMKGHLCTFRRLLKDLRPRPEEAEDLYFDEWKDRFSGEESRRYLAILDREASENLYGYRLLLRGFIEDFEGQAEPIRKFVASQIGENTTQSQLYRQVKEERDSVIQAGRLLEAEIRDHLQLQASKLALLESRKSIELSDHQILENKRSTLPIAR